MAECDDSCNTQRCLESSRVAMKRVDFFVNSGGVSSHQTVNGFHSKRDNWTRR